MRRMAVPRLDRLLTLHFPPLWGRVEPEGRKARLPILMYHSISDEAERSVSPYFRTCTHPEVFAAQMALLRSAGYEAVGLKTGLERFHSPGKEGERLVVITFDDGFRDFYSAAHPILRQHGFHATMFLPTDYIGNESRRFQGRECMTWNETRELRKAGVEFGSHTATHPALYQLDFGQIREELEKSKAVIEGELGEAIGSFAYPYAFPSADPSFVNRFVEALKRAGYEGCVTTRIGCARRGDDPYRLRRLPANSADDNALFLAKLRGAYDWMAWPQDAFKWVRSSRFIRTQMAKTRD